MLNKNIVLLLFFILLRVFSFSQTTLNEASLKKEIAEKIWQIKTNYISDLSYTIDENLFNQFNKLLNSLSDKVDAIDFEKYISIYYWERQKNVLVFIEVKGIRDEIVVTFKKEAETDSSTYKIIEIKRKDYKRVELSFSLYYTGVSLGVLNFKNSLLLNDLQPSVDNFSKIDFQLGAGVKINRYKLNFIELNFFDKVSVFNTVNKNLFFIENDNNYYVDTIRINRINYNTAFVSMRFYIGSLIYRGWNTKFFDVFDFYWELPIYRYNYLRFSCEDNYQKKYYIYNTNSIWLPVSWEDVFENAGLSIRLKITIDYNLYFFVSHKYTFFENDLLKEKIGTHFFNFGIKGFIK